MQVAKWGINRRAALSSLLKYYLASSGGVKFGKKSSFTRCKLGNSPSAWIPTSPCIHAVVHYSNFCIHAVIRFFRQICLATPSPPTYFNKLLENTHYANTTQRIINLASFSVGLIRAA